MLTLKLQRIGKKKEPHFRLIAQEKGKNPKSKSVEILGWLNPRTKEKELKKQRIEYWLSVGAQTTDTVHNLLVSEEILKDKKRKSFKVSKKRLAKKEGKADQEKVEEIKEEIKPEEKK